MSVEVTFDPRALSLAQGDPKTLSCELRFDLSAGDARGTMLAAKHAHDVHETYVRQLMDLALIDDGLQRSPLCVFAWGELFRFRGVITVLHVKYTRFMPNGTPCCATVRLSMEELTSPGNA